MSGGRSSRWDTIKNVQTALRPPHSGRDEGQSRGMERRREDHPPPALDPPPPPPGRPAYGYPQHYPSDPGPHSGLYNSPPASAQGSPPLLHSQHYQGQFQAGSSQQGYIAPPHPGSYQYIHSQAYGQNQGYISPPPPASNPPPHPNYQQQPTPSANQSYQGGQGRQGAYPYSHSQTTYPRASNYYPPPLPPRADTQDGVGPSQSPSFAGPSYPAQSNGGALGLSRTSTAPPVLQCEHRSPGNGLCRDCEREYQRTGRK